MGFLDEVLDLDNYKHPPFMFLLWWGFMLPDWLPGLPGMGGGGGASPPAEEPPPA